LSVPVPRTDNYSGAELEELVTRAKRNAFERGAKAIGKEDFYQSLKTFRINREGREHEKRYMKNWPENKLMTLPSLRDSWIRKIGMKGAFKSIIELFCGLAMITYLLFGVLSVIGAFLILFDIVRGVEYLPLPKGLWVLMIFGAAAALFLTLLAFTVGLKLNGVLPKIPAAILTLVFPIFIMFTANMFTKCRGGVQPPPGCIESWFSWLSLIYMFYIPESFLISLMIRQHIPTKIRLPRIGYEIIIAVLFWGSICLLEGLAFILFSLEVVPAIPVEQLGPISRELWKALSFWAGIAWILALPNSIIVWKLSSKPSYGILPKILLFIIIFCVSVTLIMAFIFGPITSPNGFPWRESLLLIGITYLFYIPHILTPYILFRTLYLRYKLSKKPPTPTTPVLPVSKPPLPSPIPHPQPAPQPPIPINAPFSTQGIQWPSVGEYKIAFQDLSNCILDREIKNGVVIRKHPKTGIPIPSTGRFACVFKVQCGSKTYAVRCFFNSTIKNLQKRYELISQHLNKLSLPFFVKFEFVDRGVNIPGKGIYPFIKMEWAEGDLLDTFIEKHLGEKELLEKLAEKFIDSVIEMEKNNIAHGDLQHGNILVGVKDGSIRIYFVDYDGIFIPQFRGEEAPELGHPNYQHPRRSKKHYNEKIDRFSALIIYLSILAIANDPKLWDKYYNEDNLIFTMKDFEYPESSEVILELSNSNSEKVHKLVMFLQMALKEDPFFEETWNEIEKLVFSDREKVD
jgi:hypothetical protein